MLGYILIIVGGLGRIWCYRTLGTFFTYEITIRSSHKLIKNGPYAYVRHPSYTFVYILAIGILFVHQRLANFFPNTRWLQILLGPVGLSINFIIVALLLLRRVIHEEKALSNTFANEWTEYVSKTKRFLPGII
jgi:protein-S-isoprenylcysteine O-methyltransferase Ste14